jgi:MoaA/NifB/PqqE/SkfB family radical SAM enzyme
MCWWWGASGIVEEREDLRDELTLSELRGFVDSLIDFRPHIRITGGEPFLRRDTFDFIEHIASRGMSCSVITNGTHLNADDLGRLVDAGVTQMNISLNGDAGADAKVRGAAAFDRTMATLTTLVDMKRRRGVNHPDLIVNCVIAPDTFDGLYSLKAALADLAVPLRLQHLMWTDALGTAAHEVALKETFGIDDPTLRGFVLPDHNIDAARLIQSLEEHQCLDAVRGAPLHTLPVLTHAEIHRWYTEATFERSGGCAYVQRTARIKANGEVVGCPYINYELGNLRDQHFVAIWRGARAVRFRTALRDSLLPGCAHCCKQ